MSGASPSDRRVAELGVLAVMAFWAGNFIVVKGAIGILPPVGFTFLRYVVAALTLLILLRVRERSIGLPRGEIVKFALLGVVGFGCYQILWTVALSSIPAGDSALLIATTPVMTALLAVALRVDAPNPAKLIGALISFLGVALVIGAGQGLDLRVSLGGDLLTLGAALCWAIYTTIGANDAPTLFAAQGDDLDGGRGHALHRTGGASGSWPDADLSGFGLPVVLAILYSGTLAAGFANVVVFHGVKLLGPTRVTSLQSLVPALAVVLAAIFLGETLRPIQIVGGVVILAGVALLRRGSWPTRPTTRSVRRLAG